MPNPSRVYTCGDLAVRNQPICNIGYIKETPFFQNEGGRAGVLCLLAIPLYWKLPTTLCCIKKISLQGGRGHLD